MSIIISTASPGLSNRIKNYVSLMRKYDTIKTNIYCDNYLFGGIDIATDDDMKKYLIIDAQNYVDNERWRLKVYDEDIEYLEDYKDIDCLYDKIPNYFRETYLPYFDNLKINQEIVEYVNDFTESWDNMVGVHIRSWYCSKHRFHSNDIFEEQIDKLNPEKFFFCSDNSDVQKYFVDKYGDKVVTYERQMFNHPHLAESGHHNDVQITTDAFIELLILSKCSTIIGTYDSTFDEVAWWMSGCKSKVIIPMPKNFDQKYHDSQFIRK